MTAEPLPADAVVVTAADSGYFNLLKGLIASIRDLEEKHGIGGKTAIKVVNIGLTPDQCAELRETCDVLEEPQVQIPLPSDGKLPPSRRGNAVKPLINDCFPGYGVYIWIDADAWVQEWPALGMLATAGRAKDFAAVPEIDRAYRMLYDRKSRLYWGIRNWNADAYGKEVARKMAGLPVVNAGVFAMRAGSPLWELWRKNVTHVYHNAKEYFSDQVALNYVLCFEQIDWYPLPSTCNWICSQAAPRFDVATKLLTEPLIPHQPLGIVHLTNKVLEGEGLSVPLSTGGTRKMRLDYFSLRELRASG